MKSREETVNSYSRKRGFFMLFKLQKRHLKGRNRTICLQKCFDFWDVQKFEFYTQNFSRRFENCSIFVILSIIFYRFSISYSQFYCPAISLFLLLAVLSYFGFFSRFIPLQHIVWLDSVNSAQRTMSIPKSIALLNGSVRVVVLAKPGARKSNVISIDDEAIGIQIAAPARSVLSH